MRAQTRIKLTRYFLAICPVILTYFLYKEGLAPLALPILYIGCSIVAFLAYAHDKSCAETGEWRIPEGQLHMMEFVFGWPGAIIAQEELRHKSVKTEFRQMFMLASAANVACVGTALWISNRFL